MYRVDSRARNAIRKNDAPGASRASLPDGESEQLRETIYYRSQLPMPLVALQNR